MAKNSTQRYIDNEKSFLSGMMPNIKPIPIREEAEIDIDVDMEKQISQLQEARINGILESKSDLPVDPDKQLKEWQLEKEFTGFLNNVGKEKEDTSKKIEEEERKISALEILFTDLMAAKSGKKKKQLLVEPEKPKVEPVKLKEKPKPVLELTKEEIEKRYVNLPKEEVFIDENARRIVAEKYSELGNATLHSFLSPKEIKSDPDIINKVMSHIKEMKVANELEKEKMTGLRSIDTLEKLTREFLNFKHITSMQMGTIGGGGSVNVLDSDDIDDTDIANEKVLEYNSTTKKLQFVSQGSGTANVTIPDGGTIGSASDTDAITIDSSGNVTLSQNLTVSGTQTTVDSTTVSIQNAFVFEGATADAYETTLTTVDPTADRTISLPNISGTIPVLAAASATQITSTPAELNILDGATVVVGEINALDLGSTAVGTAIASKAVILDSNKDYTDVRNLTISGELDAATGDFSGNVDIDGTLEADAITVDGTTLAEYISDTAGAMVSSNTETGIAVTYQDGDNTIDFAVDAAQTGITSIYNSSLAIGYGSSHANINFGTDNQVTFDIDGTGQIRLKDGVLMPVSDSDVDLGKSDRYFKNAYIDSITTTGDATIGGDLTVTGDDITMGTNTDTAIMVADGTNYNPVVPSGDVGLTNAGVFSIASGVVVNADVNASAALEFSKMENLTTSRLLVSDGSGDVSVSAVTSTEAGYLDGVTSAIQTQIDSASSKGFAIASAIVFG